MNARTDIHRPSAPEFDPADYEWSGAVFDNNPDFPQVNTGALAIQRQLLDQGYRFSGVNGGRSQCDHCGSLLRYAALMIHTPTRSLIYVGEQCLDNRFDGLTKAEFNRLRTEARLNRERKAAQSRFEELCASCPALAWATYARNIGYVGADYEDDEHGERSRVVGTAWEDRARASKAIDILADIARKARRYGELSPRQAELLEKLVNDLTAKDEQMVVREAERAAERAAATPAPTGRVIVRGQVIKAEYRSNPYGPGGGFKITVKTDDGWVAWGTCPAALDTDESCYDTNGWRIGGTSAVRTGRRIELTATVQPSDRDEYFAFFKRPSKAAWLD